jgi:MYXO-CTERM domain-containing protein
MGARLIALVVFLGLAFARHDLHAAPCTSNQQCDDGNDCTADFCSSTGQCEHQPIPNCCEHDADCADMDVCTVDTCDPFSHQCRHSEITNCCTDNRDCFDLSMCTTDSCNTATNTCVHTAIPNCCMTDQQCFDGNFCTMNTCNVSTGTCATQAIPGCCQTNGDCSDGDSCTFDRCDPQSHTCQHFDEPNCCQSDADCHDGNICTLDQCDLATHTCTNQPISDCCTNNAQCQDGSFCTIDSCDPSSHTCKHMGIPNCCHSNSDCNDHDACTTDRCDMSNGTCSNSPISGCCEAGGDCNDNNACTVDTCDLGSHTCQNMPVAGCCTTNADCNDNDGCTRDTCDATTHTCSHATEMTCCKNDADCDDHNACTHDTCNTTDGTCSHDNTCGDAGVGGDANGFELSGGGCACDTGGHGTPVGGILLAVIVAGLLRRRRGAIAAIAVLGAAGSVRADGFDAGLSRPVTSSTGYFTQESGAVLPRGQLDLGAWLDFARDPLVARNPSTGDELMNGGIVENRLGMQLTAGFGVTRWLEVGAALPLVLAQSGDVSLLSMSRSLSTTALGDLRLFGKARIWSNGELSLAGALDVTVPSGDSTSFTGASTASARPRAIVGWQHDAFTAAFDAGFRFQGSSTVADVTVGSEVTLGAAASYAVMPSRLWVLGEAFAAIGVDGNGNDTPAEALLGGRAVVSGPWRAQLAVGAGLGRGVTAPAFETVGSMSYVAGLEKPRPPELPKVFDRDHDGIPDAIDKCPDDPEDKDGFQDDDGCPDLDNDNDGIPDATDKCPLEPEDKDGFQDDDGCPDPDNDFDGIPDTTDKCPNEPEDKDGFQDDDGCPDLDNDQDGIPDASDTCPDQPETKNGFQDDDGCPDEIPEPVQKLTGVVKGVNFKSGSAELLPGSSKVLDQAVATLQQYPDLRLEIQGHTDDVPVNPHGKYKDNDELSAARAETVRDYIAAMGIAPTRVVAHGYGATRPIDDPATLTGGKLRTARAKNRRVEFQIIVAP